MFRLLPRRSSGSACRAGLWGCAREWTAAGFHRHGRVHSGSIGACKLYAPIRFGRIVAAACCLMIDAQPFIICRGIINPASLRCARPPNGSIAARLRLLHIRQKPRADGGRPGSAIPLATTLEAQGFPSIRTARAFPRSAIRQRRTRQRYHAIERAARARLPASRLQRTAP